MLNVMLAGVGGQGTVLAAKVLAQAAQDKGWYVRTAETIGMAQRGGSVVSHVRMGNEGEQVRSPLIARGSADMIIAFEPGEAARALPYLAADGVLVTATTDVRPVSAAIGERPYRGAEIIERLYGKFGIAEGRLIVVPDQAVLRKVGNRRVLNTVLLANAFATDRLPLTLDELRDAVRACVKPAFVDVNLRAIDAAVG